MVERLLVAVPKDIVPRGTSEDIQKFERVTGIKHTRRFAGSTYEMITKALDHLKVVEVPQNLVVITQSPDQLSPCTAAKICHYMHFPESTLAFDVNHACDGWVLGVYLANRLKGRTMLICADRLRYEPNYLESFMFSDAVSVSQIIQGLDVFKSYTDGSRFDDLYCGLDGEMHMNGSGVFDFVTTKIPKFIKEFGPHDYLIPHQANLSMLKLLEKRSGYQDRTLYSIEQYGNQSMNTIPTCLALNNKLAHSTSVLCVGFGAGFTAAGMSMFWAPVEDPKIVEI